MRPAPAAAAMVAIVAVLTQFQGDLCAWAGGSLSGGSAGDGGYGFQLPDGSSATIPCVEKIEAVLAIDTTSAAADALRPISAAFAPWQGQLATWRSGTVLDGPAGDGYYPFTTPTGGVFTLECPAALAALGDADLVSAGNRLGDLMQALADWSAGTLSGGPAGNGYYPFLQPDGVTLQLACFERMIDTASAGLNIPAARLPRISDVLAFGPQTGSCVLDDNFADGSTYHQMMAIETTFDGVQLVFMNHSGVPITIGPVKVASLASVDAGFGNDLAWSNISFGGRPTVTIPAGGSVSPNTGLANAPEYVFSDPLEIINVERTDLPALGLLLVRTFIPAAITSVPLQAEYTTPPYRPLNWNIEPNGRIWLSWLGEGDHVTDTSAFPADATATNRWPCVIIKAVSTQRGGRVAIIANPGDSIQNGGGGGTGGHVYRALQKVNQQGLPLSFVGMGWIGQQSWNYLARAKKLFPLLKPDIGFFVGWSPNDATNPTATDLARSKSNVDDFLVLCETVGVTPILGTATPTGHYTAAEDDLRTAFNAYVRSKAPAVLVSDYEPVISDGGRPARYLPGVMQDDLHPNADGYDAMAGVDAANLSKIIALQLRRFVPAVDVEWSRIYGASAVSGDPIDRYAAAELVTVVGGDGRSNSGSLPYAPPALASRFGGDARANTGVMP